MSDIYDGQIFVGSIENGPRGIAARDANGQKLGVFPNAKLAVKAVLDAARDSEAALPEAIEAKTGGGA